MTTATIESLDEFIIDRATVLYEDWRISFVDRLIGYRLSREKVDFIRATLKAVQAVEGKPMNPLQKYHIKAIRITCEFASAAAEAAGN